MVFPMNITPTFLLSDEDKRILRHHSTTPVIADILRDAHVDAPSAPQPIKDDSSVMAPTASSAVLIVAELPPVSNYHMRNAKVARVLV